MFFVLWGCAPPDAGAAAVEGATSGSGGFLCVEPWLGGPDALNGRCALLAGGEEMEWGFDVTIEEPAEAEAA